MSHVRANRAGLSSMRFPGTASAAGHAQRPAHGWTAPGTAEGPREGASVCDSAIVLPLGGGMSPSGILVTGGKPERRIVGKVLVDHLFFLDDPLPEHQAIEGEPDHE